MRKLTLLAGIGTLLLAAPAMAQDASSPDAPASSPGRSASQTGGASDGSRAFGFVPYFGVMGGWEQFDNERISAGIPQILNPNGTKNTSRKLNGSLVEGVAGVNIPVGPFFAGVEGNVAKGVTGDIDWEYGAAGRGGLRAGDSGLIYGKVGYEWVNFERIADTRRDYHDWEYGIGFEVGPKDIGLGGITNRAGLRLRGEVSTFGAAHSFRPMAGIIAHF